MDGAALAAGIGAAHLRTADSENVLYQDWGIISHGRNTKFQGVRHENWGEGHHGNPAARGSAGTLKER